VHATISSDDLHALAALSVVEPKIEQLFFRNKLVGEDIEQVTPIDAFADCGRPGTDAAVTIE
jgi:hypothetical protein